MGGSVSECEWMEFQVFKIIILILMCLGIAYKKIRLTNEGKQWFGKWKPEKPKSTKVQSILNQPNAQHTENDEPNEKKSQYACKP